MDRQYKIGTEFFVMDNILGGRLFKKDDIIFIQSTSAEESFDHEFYEEGSLYDFVYHMVSRGTGVKTSIAEKFLNQLHNEGRFIPLVINPFKDKERAGHPLTKIFK
jgi:hypothetical protein